MYDAKAFRGLLEGAEERRRVSELLGDDAYDSGETFGALEARSIEAVVKPWRGSRPLARAQGGSGNHIHGKASHETAREVNWTW